MKGQALRGRHSTEPLAVNRDTNCTSSTEALLADIQAQLRASGRRMSMSGLRRLHRRWLESAQADWDFGRYVLTYADPTGEKATSRALAHQVRRFT